MSEGTLQPYNLLKNPTLQLSRIWRIDYTVTFKFSVQTLRVSVCLSGLVLNSSSDDLPSELFSGLLEQ